jgi:uncharacterized RDD family membrane protein YckC
MDTPVVSYAGFWKRFLAHLIDQIVLGLVSGILIVPLGIIAGLGAFSSGSDYGNSDSAMLLLAALGGYLFVVILIVVAASWIYYALMESSAKGATLGKMALGIHVTDLTGNRISFARASGRYFGKIISGLILYIGYIMAGFTQQKQALHDIMAGCLVINK